MTNPAQPRHAVDPDDDKLDAAVLKTAGIVVIGVIMAILDMTIVNVAVPSFKDTFDTSFAVAAWTMTGYTLALATVIPLTGWAADRFGTKRLYILALTLFVAGSVLCSFATSIEMLIGFRVLQGLGGGMLMPLSMTIMTHAAGPHRVGRVMAVLGVPMLLGPISGPIIGGWLLDHASWHWIFLINLPIGIVAIALAVFGLKPDRPEPSESFDFLGMLLLSPGLALFLFGVSSIPEELRTQGGGILDALTTGRVAISAILGLILMIAFIPHAFRTEHPLVDLTLFKNRDLTVSVICFVFFTIAFFGAMLLLPAYLIQVRGETPFDTGLMLAPQGLGAMLTMPVAGALTDKIGPRKIVIPGVGLIALTMAFFTQITADTAIWQILVALFIMGLGMGCTMMPIMTAAIATLTHHQVARGSTLMNIVNQSGGSIGTAIMSMILTVKYASAPAGIKLPDGTAMSSVDVAYASWDAKFYAMIQGIPGIDKIIAAGFDAAAAAFAFTFLIALILIVLTLIPSFLLPSKAPVKKEGEPAPVLVH
ncbi:DHA2 family efflux MFS transporter permease subunit [Smaragdicoccus niigatensis]|uniref:DHA2 family efflux MFS transporter permease subunit n=1 Tax=Smaragdicoccus niigatensis TaxID=359359 RepID=UPI0003A510C0|nr:DHA2 family efflux MFS transporter permease subunit [Smaragdicoccus niigatensis]